MGDPILTGIWKSQIVLACMTCEDVILLSRTDKDRTAVRKPLQKVVNLLPIEFAEDDHRSNREMMANLFVPTVCSSCSKCSSWKTFVMNKSFIEIWELFLAMRAYLEGDLSLLGRLVSVVHLEDVKNAVGSFYVMQSVKINPSAEAAAEIEPYLKGGFL